MILVIIIMSERMTDLARERFEESPSTHSRAQSVLISLINIVKHQNYHDITNITKLLTFTLYLII